MFFNGSHLKEICRCTEITAELGLFIDHKHEIVIRNGGHLEKLTVKSYKHGNIIQKRQMLLM